MPAGQVGHGPECVGVEHHARRIARRVENDRLRAIGDGRFDPIRRNRKIGIAVHGYRCSADQIDEVPVHHEVRVEEDHFIARIDARHQRQKQTARDSGHHEHRRLETQLGR